jgi:hypothetical protein
MRRASILAPMGLSLTLAVGCTPNAVEPPAPVSAPASVSRPAEPSASPPVEISRPREAAASKAEVSWDSEEDRRFAEFLRDNSGGMVSKAAVGIARKGLLQVELGRDAAPDDTLPLTRSLLAGARKDFPGKPITMKVFDPSGDPILTARYRPGHGVDYQLAHDDAKRSGEAPPAAEPGGDPLDRSGTTAADRKFAAWAEEHGRAYIRYVQADLERNGRLWFGVTRDVKPADVPDLTRSLLEGAMKEFPQRELTATVFDPDGERIGKAHLDARGRVRWEE